MSAVAELAADVTRAAGLGHNQPPADFTPFDGIKLHIDDLLVEAHAWADGTVVENQAQADEASRLIDDLQKAAKAADAQRVVENEPFDTGKAAVQAKYAPLIADPKTKNPGKVWKAIDALKATVKPYLDRLREEQEAEARRKRAAAEEAARVAAEAARAAASNDLAAQEAAEDLIRAADRANADAKRAENTKAQARGGDRAMGLRTVWRAELTDRKAALLHYLTAQPDEIVSLLCRLADRDVREGKRSLPGFDVIAETKL